MLSSMACAGLASCAVGPDYSPPQAPMPAGFTAARATSQQAAADRRVAGTTQWWRTLHDRELDSLIDRAIAASPTLEIALDRLQQARAQEFAVIGSALPMLGGSEGGAIGTGTDLGRGRASQTLVSAENGTNVSQITNLVGFDAAWEIDVFGKFRRAIEATQYDVEAAIAARNVVLISLVADVTRAYLDLRALQMRLALLQKQIGVVQKYVDFVQERFSRGITNELDVTLAQRQLAQLQAEIAPLIAQINAARYVIAVLVGEFPESLGQELTKPGMLPALPGRIRPVCRSTCSGVDPTLPRRNANWRAPTLSSASRLPACFPKWLSPLLTARSKDRTSSKHRSIRYGRSGRRSLRRCWILAGSMRWWRKPTIAAASFCSTTNRRCSTPCVKWTPPSMPMRRNRRGCAISPTL